jgi:hypothetical protein
MSARAMSPSSWYTAQARRFQFDRKILTEAACVVLAGALYGHLLHRCPLVLLQVVPRHFRLRIDDDLDPPIAIQFKRIKTSRL